MRAETVRRQDVVARRLGVDLSDGPHPRWTDEDEVEEALDAGISQIQAPGRHLSQRNPGAVGAGVRVPGLGVEIRSHHLGVVATVLAGALALTCWWLLSRTPQVLTPPPRPTAALVTPASVTSVTAPSTITVDVAGLVRRPGVRALPPGSRVIDALQAAGGARRQADLTQINQARLLVDGEQILVTARGERGAMTRTAPGFAGSQGGGGLVNLNTATLADLDTLPGVGPVTAQAIVDYRTEHGGFAAVQELLDVQGIGEATLAKLEPHVTV